jgi:hypothetical protein
MEGSTILIMNHIYKRRMSYISGVMTFRSSVDGNPLGERLSTLSTEDLEKVDEHDFDTLDLNTGLLESSKNIMPISRPF